MKAHPTIAALARREGQGSLEVEHLLGAASYPAPDLAAALDVLAAERGWKMHPCFPEVAFGSWAAVVSIYCRSGHEGLLAAAHAPDLLPFVFGLLETLKTDEALVTVVRIAARDDIAVRADPEQTRAIVNALNLTAMNSPSGGPTEPDRVAGRDFLHAASARATSDDQWGSLLCALRFFADESSLALISDCPPLPPHWEPARKGAVRAIRKAMKRPS